MNFLNSHRRHFLQQSSALAFWTAAGIGHAAEEGKPTVPQFCKGKDPRLVGHNTKSGEIETPIELLREHRLTPKGILFVRNNQYLPDSLTLEPAPLDGWNIDFTGLISATRQLSAKEIQKLPAVEHEFVMQCSGNGRTWYASTVKAEGVPWGNGAMGNIRCKGVALSTILEHYKIQISPKAKFIAVEGADVPTKPGAEDFEHSLPLAEALEKSFFAFEMNGEPLPKLHGGPVRFITPGYYATMNVKWVNRIRFEADESKNHNHVGRYRTPLKPIAPGSKFDSTLENSEPNWNMKIRSVVFGPLPGQSVPAGSVEIYGVAWNDGSSKIIAVEVSTDGGETWRRSKLESNGSPYAWQHWKLSVNLPKGKHSIQSRAVDALGRTQPLDGSVHWNPAGYAWGGVERIEINVT